MKHRNKILISALGLAVIAVLGSYLYGWSPVDVAGSVLNAIRSAHNPPGTIVVELSNGATVDAATDNAANTTSETNPQPFDAGSWPSFNRTLTSQRYSSLSEINTQTARGLKVLCSYDTHLRESFETGPLVVDGALIGTTAADIFSIDPSNCHENWRTHEDYKLPGPLRVNRGAAYWGGRLFRGTLDGRVLAYDFKTGKRVWATTIADAKTGDIVDSAAIAWNGLVFIGTAFGDLKGVKSRVYALAADSGRIVWETYLVPTTPSDPTRGPRGAMPASASATWKNAPDVPISGGGNWTSYTLEPATGRLYVPVGNPSPDFVKGLREGANLYTNTVVALDAKTGAYITHFPVAPADWHDWDVSNAPAINVTRGGKRLLSFAPKNGYLYGFDLATNQLLYRSPVTRIENAEAPLSTDKETRFCPGSSGGGEFNGAAYDPQYNLVFTGQVEWCTTVRLQPDKQVKAIGDGRIWMGHEWVNPLDVTGGNDPHSQWAGWLYATDADSGQWKWRLKSNYPILSGVTPTGGGVVFFGDIGGNFYVVNASNGQWLWGQKLDGAIGGGVITYTANGSQKVAVAAGLTSIFWPTEQATAKIVVLGLSKPPQ